MQTVRQVQIYQMFVFNELKSIMFFHSYFLMVLKNDEKCFRTASILSLGSIFEKDRLILRNVKMFSLQKEISFSLGAFVGLWCVIITSYKQTQSIFLPQILNLISIRSTFYMFKYYFEHFNHFIPENKTFSKRKISIENLYY